MPETTTAGATLLGALRDRLLARRRAIARRAERSDRGLDDLAANAPSEPEEEAQERGLARVLAELDSRDRAEIDAIDAAMIRIERGDYGRCETCGDPIEIERLEVLPTARRCTACAEATERDAKMTMAAPRDEEV